MHTTPTFRTSCRPIDRADTAHVSMKSGKITVKNIYEGDTGGFVARTHAAYIGSFLTLREAKVALGNHLGMGVADLPKRTPIKKACGSSLRYVYRSNGAYQVRVAGRYLGSFSTERAAAAQVVQHTGEQPTQRKRTRAEPRGTAIKRVMVLNTLFQDPRMVTYCTGAICDFVCW